jgi:glycosyltransferase involved in cell wall biosynthesis
MSENKNQSVTMVGALPPLKGNAYYCMSLSRELSKHIATEFISFKRLYPEFLYPGGVEDADRHFRIDQHSMLKIHRIISYFNPFTWIRAAWIAQSGVVHLQWWSLPLAPIYLVILIGLKIRRKKIIFTVHNVVPHEKSILDRWLTKIVLAFGDAYIVHSKENQKTLAETFKIPEANVNVVHMPIFDMYVRSGEDSASIRRRLGLPDKGKVLLSFGNIRPYKGLDLLIEAMPEVLRAVPDAHLLVAGQNWGKWNDPYGQLIHSLEIERSVTALLDYIPMSQVADIFQVADVVVLPYKYFDAQSGVGNIALAFEIPMVVTRVGGLADLVQDDQVVCPPEDAQALAQAIIPTLLDDQFRSKLKSDARRLKSRYSWSTAVSQTMKIYQQLS